MKMTYQRPSQLQIREHDWRPTPGRVTAPGCVPGLSFEMSLFKQLPPRELWPDKSGTVDWMFAWFMDARFTMSEIVRCRLNPDLFGQAYQRAPRLGREVLTILRWHRRNRPEFDHLDAYIAEGRKARNRLTAHRLLSEMK